MTQYIVKLSEKSVTGTSQLDTGTVTFKLLRRYLADCGIEFDATQKGFVVDDLPTAAKVVNEVDLRYRACLVAHGYYVAVAIKEYTISRYPAKKLGTQRGGILK